MAASGSQENQLGHFLRSIRIAKGISMASLGAKAGIAHSTISRWESGKYAPFIPELRALLKALEATPEESKHALLLINAPRASKAFSDEIRSPLYASVSDRGLTGALLRAIRLRNGVSQKKLARLLKVDPSTISHWEGGRTLPQMQVLDEVLCTLQVEPKERLFLSGENHPVSEPLHVDEIRLLSDQFLEATRTCPKESLDLEALTLNWLIPRIRDEDLSKRLLLRLWSNYSGYLDLRGRTSEAQFLSSKALLLAKSFYANTPHYHGGLDAITTYCRTQFTFEAKHARKAYMFLSEWQTTCQSAFFQSVIYLERASLDLLEGYTSSAEINCQQAEKYALKADHPNLLNQQRYTAANILLAQGKPDHALETLEDPQVPITTRRWLEYSLFKAKAFLAAGDKQAAAHNFQTCRTYVEEHSMGLFEGALETLAPHFV